MSPIFDLFICFPLQQTFHSKCSIFICVSFDKRRKLRRILKISCLKSKNTQSIRYLCVCQHNAPFFISINFLRTFLLLLLLLLNNSQHFSEQIYSTVCAAEKHIWKPIQVATSEYIGFKILFREKMYCKFSARTHLA